MLNPGGLCRCGCGQPTSLATANRSELGHVKGEPTLWLAGHKQRTGMKIWTFNGSRCILRGRDGQNYFWYRVVARNMIGREIRRDECVHHVNGDPTDDREENLQVLTRREHYAVHRRQGDIRILTAEDQKRSCDLQRNTVTRACGFCGKDVARPASHQTAKTAYCTPVCWRAAQAQNPMRGVRPYRGGPRWIAQFSGGGHIGLFDTLESAITARGLAEQERHAA